MAIYHRNLVIGKHKEDQTALNVHQTSGQPAPNSQSKQGKWGVNIPIIKRFSKLA